MKGWPPRLITPIPEKAESRGEEVGEFIEAFVTLTKDSIAGSVGEPIHLFDWQRELLRQMFILNPDGTFRHRTIYVGVGRKNGKSALAAGIGLWSLFMHDRGGETYSCAATKDQARITFNDARKLIEGNSELSAVANVYRDAIEIPSTGSIWRVLASESFGAEGLNASCVIFDEIHALPDRRMWDVMQLSMASRKQPLMIATTTAGVKKDSTGQDSTAYDLYNYLKRVSSGEQKDETFFGAWWEADADADHRSEQAWKDGNPGYGSLNSPEDFQAMVARTPEAEFRTKRCNQWVSSQTAWLPAGSWDELKSEREVSPDDEIILGFDGSFSGDCTVLVACVIPKTEEEKPFLWLVKEWEKDLTIHDDQWRVDIQEVEETIMNFVQKYPKTREVACDPFRWQRSMEVLADRGIPIVEWPSTSPKRMVQACAKFYDAVTGGTLEHDGSPVLTRHLDNAVTKIDNLGIRIVKENRHSPRKIDAAVAAVIAFDRAVSSRMEEMVPDFFF
jgi:phage terminase large subunit-like protein